MAKKYFLPRKDEDKLLWLKNFNEKLATYATLLGVTPDEVSATDKFYLLFASDILSPVGVPANPIFRI
ncbi:MAG: hypothetical protein ACKVPJ_12975 [Chitinophagales bacterium]